METYYLTVNGTWIKLAHAAVHKYADTWPGGDPGEQQALLKMKTDLDKLMLEVAFQQ